MVHYCVLSLKIAFSCVSALDCIGILLKTMLQRAYPIISILNAGEAVLSCTTVETKPS